MSHIFVTHSHLDHSPLAAQLSRDLAAPVYAFGDSHAGRSAIMQELLRTGLSEGGEGRDETFAPDIHLHDGQTVSGPWGAMTALHTPGHMANHMCFLFGEQLFVGDHVMGWASSLVSPPDGDLTDFMASCEKLMTVRAAVQHSGHGAPILQPQARLRWLIDHRRARERQIRAALGAAPADARTLAKAIYADAPPALLPAATRNVFAHLIDLYQRKTVTTEHVLSQDAVFEIRP